MKICFLHFSTLEISLFASKKAQKRISYLSTRWPSIITNYSTSYKTWTKKYAKYLVVIFSSSSLTSSLYSLVQKTIHPNNWCCCTPKSNTAIWLADSRATLPSVAWLCIWRHIWRHGCTHLSGTTKHLFYLWGFNIEMLCSGWAMLDSASPCPTLLTTRTAFPMLNSQR